MALLLAGVLGRQGLGKVNQLFSTLLDGMPLEAPLKIRALCAGLLAAIVRDLRPLQFEPID